jgi:hypothetical protein
MWIRWIWIRIRNTATNLATHLHNVAGTGAAGDLGGGGDEEQVHRLQHVQLSHQEEQGAHPARRQVRKVMRTFYF